MLVAELDANGVAVVVAAIFLGLQQLYAMYLSSKRSKETACKVEEVKTTLITTNAIHEAKAEARNNKLDLVAEKVDIVRKETNGMKDQLVTEVRKSAFMEGVKSVTDSKGDVPR